MSGSPLGERIPRYTSRGVRSGVKPGPEGGECSAGTLHSHPISGIGCDAMLSAEPSQAGDGSPYLATIAPDTEQVLAHDAAVDAHDLGNFLLRLTVDEIEEQGLSLTKGQ